MGLQGSSFYRTGRRVLLAVAVVALAFPAGLPSRTARAAECPWMDTTKTPHRRATMLLAAMTIDDKINMVGEDYTYFTPYGGAGYVEGNPDLCIPDLTLNDAGSGVANAQINTTAFPTGIAQAATFDRSLQQRFGEALGKEAWQKGVNVWLAPGVNIGRVPMNGRNFEYVGGEDPYLGGQMASVAIRGAQSQHVVATVKHYALNNQETDRNTVSADVDDRTVHEIYLPAFEAAVREGGVGSAMCAYNKFNGVYACENPTLLKRYLKDELGFDGWVMTDWGAQHSTVAAANAGLDMEMSGQPASYFAAPLKTAVENGQVPMSRLNDMVLRILRTMFRVGLFDYPVSHPETPGPTSNNVSTPDHVALARTISEDSTVLLKNSGPILPLEGTGQTIAVIGRAAGDGAREVCGGGGSSAVQSCNTATVTPLQGIQQRAAANSDTVTYADGGSSADAVAAATAADVAIVFGYYTATEGGDRATLALDDDGDALITSVAEANPNTVVVLNTGGPTPMPWLSQVKAVLEAWYPGIEDGNAIAAVLFGDANPSGKLPQTFPKRTEDLPASTPAQYPGVDGHAKYSEGVFVGYRHYDAHGVEPLFAFGFGLSYTTFRMSDLRIEAAAPGSGSKAIVSVGVTNTGARSGAAVPQLYLGLPSPSAAVRQPPRALKGFDKIALAPGETRRVSFALDDRAFSYWDTPAKAWRVAPGCYRVMVGSSSRDLPLSGVISRGGASCGSNALVLDQVVVAPRPAPLPATEAGAGLPATGSTDGAGSTGLALLVAGLLLTLALARASRMRVQIRGDDR